MRKPFVLAGKVSARSRGPNQDSRSEGGSWILSILGSEQIELGSRLDWGEETVREKEKSKIILMLWAQTTQ